MSSPFFCTILSISSSATMTTRFSSSSFSRSRLYTRSVGFAELVLDVLHDGRLPGARLAEDQHVARPLPLERGHEDLRELVDVLLPVRKALRDVRRPQDLAVHLEDRPRPKIRLEYAFLHVIPLPLKARRFVLARVLTEDFPVREGRYQGVPLKGFVDRVRDIRHDGETRFLFVSDYDRFLRDRIESSTSTRHDMSPRIRESRGRISSHGPSSLSEATRVHDAWRSGSRSRTAARSCSGDSLRSSASSSSSRSRSRSCLPCPSPRSQSSRSSWRRISSYSRSRRSSRSIGSPGLV